MCLMGCSIQFSPKFVFFLFQDSTDVCTFCENIIKDVRALLDDKSEQVRNYNLKQLH
jgi:hypothetical protein